MVVIMVVVGVAVAGDVNCKLNLDNENKKLPEIISQVHNIDDEIHFKYKLLLSLLSSRKSLHFE